MTPGAVAVSVRRLVPALEAIGDFRAQVAGGELHTIPGRLQVRRSLA